MFDVNTFLLRFITSMASWLEKTKICQFLAVIHSILSFFAPLLHKILEIMMKYTWNIIINEFKPHMNNHTLFCHTSSLLPPIYSYEFVNSNECFFYQSTSFHTEICAVRCHSLYSSFVVVEIPRGNYAIQDDILEICDKTCAHSY